MTVTIDEAIAMVKRLYEEACKRPYIQKPIAYALYHAWKAFDMVERKEE